MELLDSQKVELFEHIVENGYNPRDFEYKVYTCRIGKKNGERGYELNEIKYRPANNNSFSVHVFSDNFSIRCTPHTKSVVYTTVVKDWDSVLTILKNWLCAINREEGAKNVWELILTGEWKKKISIPAGEFTYNEKVYIRNRLTELINEVSSDNRIDDCTKRGFIKELENSKSFANMAPRKSDWIASLLFHLYTDLGKSGSYRVIQNYASQLLIGFGREININNNRFFSRYTVDKHENLSLEI